MSGPSSLPPAPPGPPTQPPNTRDGTPAKILSADGSLAQLSRPATVTGQVVSLSSDGTMRIHTDQGDISLQPRNSTTQLVPGQTVEIDLSAGRPPRQATIRPADPAQNTASTAPGAAPPATGTQTPAAVAPSPGGANINPNGGNGQGQNAAGAGGAAANRPPPPLISDAVTSGLSDAGPPAAAAASTQVDVEMGDLLRLQPILAGTPLLPPSGSAAVESTNLPLASGVILPGTLTVTGAPLQITVPPATILPKLVTPLIAPPLVKPPALAAPPAIAGKPVAAPATTLPAATLPPSLGLEPVPANALSAKMPAVPLTTAPAFGTARLSVNRPLDIRVATLLPPPPRFMPPGSVPSASFPRPAAAPVAGAPTVLTGMIVGRVAQPGFAPLPVLSVTLPGQATPQLFAVQVAASNLPAGTLVTFTPQMADLDAAGDDALPSGALLPAIQWASLSAIHDAANSVMPHAALPLAALLPNPAMPDALPPAALLFVAALRSGDLVGWLGEKTIDALRRAGEDDLMARLDTEGAALTRLDMPASAADSWRMLPMPLLWEGDVQRMILRYRRDRAAGDKAEDKRRRGTRFVFDMALSRMGPVQLDGLHKPKAGMDDNDRLDLIVRTRNGLSAAMQAAMRLRYHEALVACDHRGEMMFQYRPEQWLKFDKPEGLWTR